MSYGETRINLTIPRVSSERLNEVKGERTRRERQGRDKLRKKKKKKRREIENKVNTKETYHCVVFMEDFLLIFTLDRISDYLVSCL